MTEADIQEIELNIKQAQEFVALGNSLDRLISSRDFKKIILEGYFEKEAIRLVHLKGDVNMQTAERQASILRQMDSVSGLRDYLEIVSHRANAARKAIEDNESALEELAAESLSA